MFHQLTSNNHVPIIFPSFSHHVPIIFPSYIRLYGVGAVAPFPSIGNDRKFDRKSRGKNGVGGLEQGGPVGQQRGLRPRLRHLRPGPLAAGPYVFPYADDRAIGWHPIGKSMELMWLYVVETC